MEKLAISCDFSHPASCLLLYGRASLGCAHGQLAYLFIDSTSRSGLTCPQQPPSEEVAGLPPGAALPLPVQVRLTSSAGQ